MYKTGNSTAQMFHFEKTKTSETCNDRVRKYFPSSLHPPRVYKYLASIGRYKSKLWDEKKNKTSNEVKYETAKLLYFQFYYRKANDSNCWTCTQLHQSIIPSKFIGIFYFCKPQRIKWKFMSKSLLRMIYKIF